MFIAFTASQISYPIFFPGLIEKPKCQVVFFFSLTNHSGDGDGGTSTTSQFDLVLNTCLNIKYSLLRASSKSSILSMLSCGCSYYLADS